MSSHSSPSAPGLVLGVLAADPQHLEADQAAGIREAMMNIDWSAWEPAKGRDDRSYVAQQVAIANRYRAHGWTVAVDVGLQAPPSWVLAQPNGQLLDQNGHPSGQANYEYSQTVRSQAVRYIAGVVKAMGKVSSYRIGLGSAGEMMYPEAPDNQWWAFSPDAQHGGSDLPPGVPATPLPGWVPGTPTWKGEAITTTQVSNWYDWYYGALVNALAWEISAFRWAGYHGTLQLLMAGYGAVPYLYSEQMGHDLAASSLDSYHTMNTATVFWRMLPDLARQVSLANTVMDITGVTNLTGEPPGNACQPSDRSVPLAFADPWYSGWSSTRWMAYLAAQNGLPVIGENPGNTSPSDVGPIISLAGACGLSMLQWAWDSQLHSGNPSLASLSQLQAAWEGYRRGLRR